MAKQIPEGFHTVSPALTVRDGADAVFDRAVKAGAKVVMPVTDMFWGDRFGQVEDPSGHRWGLATHTEDLTPDEMGRRQQQFLASMTGQTH